MLGTHGEQVNFAKSSKTKRKNIDFEYCALIIEGEPIVSMLSYTFYLKFVTYNKSIMTFAPISFPMQSEPLPFASSASVIINDLAYKDSFNQFVIQWRDWVSQRLVG